MPNQTITAPEGFRCGAAACGIKKTGALDLAVLAADEACPAAAVFTRNRFCGCPVTVGRQHIRRGRLRAVVVNSGCSNVATGARGLRDARTMCRLTARGLNADETEILPASTGVIGRYLPMDRVRAGIRAALAGLSPGPGAGEAFARAIMTTDTRLKQACTRVRIGRQRIAVAGCCKGSGMIAPNMATMLAFLTTDAGLPAGRLARLLRAAVEPTFNRITVDECPSTSDTVALLAGGRAGALTSDRAIRAFAEALRSVCGDLARQIVADGEGATRVLEITVTGARSPREAHATARAVAASPLVKTAVHGGDPNWGRIVQAVGAVQATYRPEKVRVWLAGTLLFARGGPARGLDLRRLSARMRQPHVPVRIDLGAGKASDRVWTCDLSREYVAINADYTT